MASLQVNDRWYAVQTQARAEERATQQLTIQGYKVFAPLIWRTNVRRAGLVRITPAPLFPSYIFVALNLRRDRWRSINGTIGVSGLVMAGNTPLPLPHGLIESLARQRLCEGQIRIRETFKLDQAVQFQEGPFSDVVGRIDQMDPKGRVQVLLAIMGRIVRVDTRSSTLAPRA